MTRLGSPKSSGQLGGQRMEANGHVAGEKTRSHQGQGQSWRRSLVR